mgnify:CR=1 FL=1
MHDFISMHRTGCRLLKKIHSVDSCIIPLHLLELCLELVRIYGGLFLTAALIDALLPGDYRQAVLWTLFLLLLNVCLGILNQVLKRRFKGLKTEVWLLFYVWLRQKAFSMDFETMERPEVSEKILFSERTSDMYGGLGILLYQYCNLLRAVLNLVLSTFLVVHLCLAQPACGGRVWRGLASPGVCLGLFSLVLAGMVACAWKVFRHFAARQKDIFASHTGVEDRLGYFMNQIYGNTRMAKNIRIFGMEGMILKNTGQFQARSRAYFAKMCDVGRQESNANGVVNSVFTICAYLLVGIKVVTGAVTVGAFTRYAGALNQFGGACFALIAGHGELQKICTYMEEFLAFLDMRSHHEKGSIPIEKRTDGEYELAFEDVSFHYPGSEEMVLQHINCRIPLRGRLALVGCNGAGKSTFIKLLCRLYEPTEGRITLNGVDIRKYDEEEYRSLFGVVFQDFKLFALPVWENIVAGYEIRDDRIWEALGLADAKELVQARPGGLDTWLYRDLEDGVEISGGEAQKLALARALYKNAPVVILDEPTAALDAKAEAEVYARFHEMVEGRTGIYISHRMSSCRFCEDILVFHEGRIVERGSHQQLSAQGGQYARMWEAQARYYNS